MDLTTTAFAKRRLETIVRQWRGSSRFVILDTACNGAQAFLSVWRAWRADPQRCAHVHVVVIDPALPTREALTVALDSTPHAADTHELLGAWPLPTPNLHTLAFEQGRVTLLLVPLPHPEGLRQLLATVDAFFLAHDILSHEPRAAKSLARLAAPGATLLAQQLGVPALKALRDVGFQVQALADGVSDGLPGAARGPTENQDDEGFTLALYHPAFTRHRSHTPKAVPLGEHHAVIVGAGLAGCAAAWALAEQGWRSTLVDQHGALATEASGNSVGLFQGVVTAHDGTHARFNRAAAAAAHDAVAIAIRDHHVLGSIDGLLQLVDGEKRVADMQRLLARLRLPTGYVRALDAAQASAAAGIALHRPAWLFPRGGWVQPRGLARAFVERARPQATLRLDAKVAALRQGDEGWTLLNARGQPILSARVLVVAAGMETLRLIGNDMSCESRRGQISALRHVERWGWVTPRLPITGQGYALPNVAGDFWFGATAQTGDADPSVRLQDHAENLAQLSRLSANYAPLAAFGGQPLAGRTAWRCTSADRLPLIGAVPIFAGSALAPSNAAATRPLDQPRFIPRQPGLFIYTALGSRGITWAALGARVLASQITGAPCPIEASLLDAVDPARFMARRHRRSMRA